MTKSLFAVGSYLSGAVPAGYIVARVSKGIDIREHGSGNPGTANVFKVVGPWEGLATLIADSMKGFLPVWLAGRCAPDAPLLPVLCGALAIVGHVWTVFLRFRGGKAVATSAGVFAALLPLPLAVDIAVFVAGMRLSGHISVGAIAAAVAFPFLAWAFGASQGHLALAVGACGLILFRHIPNVRRLLSQRRDRP